MPISAYIQSVLFVVMIAVALSASAGTIAIPGFWIYVAIYTFVFVLSLVIPDPALLEERMRPGGKRVPVALRVFTVILFVHWIVAGLDFGRFHWSDTVPVCSRPLTVLMAVVVVTSTMGAIHPPSNVERSRVAGRSGWCNSADVIGARGPRLREVTRAISVSEASLKAGNATSSQLERNLTASLTHHAEWSPAGC
jgi:hypothetical protein